LPVRRCRTRLGAYRTLPEGFAAAEHVCFYPDKVETTLDGERVLD